MTEVVEYYLTQSLLKKLLQRWLKNREFIQSHVLSFVQHRRKLIYGVLSKLQSIESDALNPSTLKSKIFPDITVARFAIDGVSTEARIKEISKHIGTRVQIYLASLSAQRRAAKAFQDAVRAVLINKECIQGYEVNLSEIPQPLGKPTLNLDFNRKDLESIVLDLVSKNAAVSLFPKPRRSTKHYSHNPNTRPRGPSKHRKS